MFKLKDYKTKKEKEIAIQNVKVNFENLISKINNIHKYVVGINITDSPAAFDLVINSDFRNAEDLKSYIEHPEHQRAVEFNKQYSIKKAVVDYEY